MIVADWMRDEKLDTAIPNEPKITERQGRRSQRPRSGRRVTRRHRIGTGGGRLAGPPPVRPIDRDLRVSLNRERALRRREPLARSPRPRSEPPSPRWDRSRSP